MVQPKMVYISQPTENGGLYSKAELTALHEVCARCGLYLCRRRAPRLRACGAEKRRLAPRPVRAVRRFLHRRHEGRRPVRRGRRPVNPALKPDFRYIVKQRGGMFAKGRLLGVQFDVLFTGGLYFEIAERAVRQALRIAEACRAAAARSSPIPRRTSSFPFFRTPRSRSSGRNTSGRTGRASMTRTPRCACARAGRQPTKTSARSAPTSRPPCGDPRRTPAPL